VSKVHEPPGQLHSIEYRYLEVNPMSKEEWTAIQRQIDQAMERGDELAAQRLLDDRPARKWEMEAESNLRRFQTDFDNKVSKAACTAGMSVSERDNWIDYFKAATQAGEWGDVRRMIRTFDARAEVVTEKRIGSMVAGHSDVGAPVVKVGGRSLVDSISGPHADAARSSVLICPTWARPCRS
jgi:hypothetical protein